MREGWRRLLDNLPWGLGLGQGYVNPDKLQGTDPHNYWLVVGGDLGVPGILLWLALLIVIARGLSRIASTPRWRPYGRALQISFWMSQFHSLVEPTFQGTQYLFIFFWVIGGAMGYYTAERYPQAAASSRR
jgi:O-antigen ligase